MGKAPKSPAWPRNDDSNESSRLEDANLIHDDVEICGEQRSVWLRKPLPEGFKEDIEAQKLFGIAAEDGYLATLADHFSMVSLRFWCRLLPGSAAAETFNQEIDRRRFDS